MLKMVLPVMAGGALGALGRYIVMIGMGGLVGFDAPYLATLAVNIIGCFSMGALVETSALVWSMSQEVRAMLVVGLLGSFTTFSAFTLDIFTLAEHGDWLIASGYTIASVVLSIGAFFAGLAFIRFVLT